MVKKCIVKTRLFFLNIDPRKMPPTQSLLQKLQRAAKHKKAPSVQPVALAAGGAEITEFETKKWNPIKAGCVCGFIVLLIIAVVLIINRLHEQSHNANLIRVRDEGDWNDLDVGDDDCKSDDFDPNFTLLKDLMQQQMQ